VFCRKRDISLCPAVAYTHTMQALAEGAVRICKEHVLCLLKASNAPARFWLFALLHFCRTYNWWPGATWQPPWESMKNSKFCFELELDLHPRGCYMVAKLPSEHPFVQENKTHADLGLEGVFLGWQDTTPSCFMYSLRQQRIIRTQDGVFEHDTDYPFLMPECIATQGILTPDQIVDMHVKDLKSGEWMGYDRTASQASTRPASPTTTAPQDGGAVAGLREDLETLKETAKQLLEPLRDISMDSEPLLRLSTRILQEVTSVQTDPATGQQPRTAAAAKQKQYPGWTSGAQVPRQRSTN
jgi:hypothetical protein